MADAVVLDTSAMLTLTGNEPGADKVQTYLAEAIAGRVQLHGSFASLTEVEYIPPSLRLTPSMNPRRTSRRVRRRAGKPELDVAKQLGREIFRPQLACHGKG